MYESPRVSFLETDTEETMTELLAVSGETSETDNEVSIDDLISGLGLL